MKTTLAPFALLPAAIDCYKPLYVMHLRSQSHSADCDPLGSITIDFEGAWAQNGHSETYPSLPSRAENLLQGSCVGALFS
jgi:hypothetical protein